MREFVDGDVDLIFMKERGKGGVWVGVVLECSVVLWKFRLGYWRVFELKVFIGGILYFIRIEFVLVFSYV